MEATVVSHGSKIKAKSSGTANQRTGQTVRGKSVDKPEAVELDTTLAMKFLVDIASIDIADRAKWLKEHPEYRPANKKLAKRVRVGLRAGAPMDRQVQEWYEDLPFTALFGWLFTGAVGAASYFVLSDKYTEWQATRGEM